MYEKNWKKYKLNRLSMKFSIDCWIHVFGDLLSLICHALLYWRALTFLFKWCFTIKKILKKFKDKSNSEHMYLWLQRIVIVANIKDIDGCSGKLFTLVTSEGSNEDRLIWNSKDWLHDDFYQIIQCRWIWFYLRSYSNFPASINPRLDVASLICATSEGFFGVMA
jgi:hypothetical protein